MNFMCKREKGGLFLPLFFPTSPHLTASFVCMYGGIDGCLEERSDFMDLTQKKKKARVHTLIFVFDQASIPWQLWVLNPRAACMQDFAKYSEARSYKCLAIQSSNCLEAR